MVGRESVADEICRNRSEIGLNLARRDSVALQRFRNSFVSSTSSFDPGNLAPPLVARTMIRSDQLRNCIYSSNSPDRKEVYEVNIVFRRTLRRIMNSTANSKVINRNQSTV